MLYSSNIDNAPQILLFRLSTGSTFISELSIKRGMASKTDSNLCSLLAFPSSAQPLAVFFGNPLSVGAQGISLSRWKKMLFSAAFLTGDTWLTVQVVEWCLSAHKLYCSCISGFTPAPHEKRKGSLLRHISL